MPENSVKVLPESKFLLTFSKNVSDTLVIVLICTILSWYVNYHWRRRKLYQAAAQRKGATPLPFIGNALYFLGSNQDLLKNILRLTSEYDSPVPIWIGQKLFFGITKAEDLEIILANPNALERGDVARFAEDIGTGLFNAPVSKWKRHRKIISPTFNQKILEAYVEVFSEQSDILVKKLKNKVGDGIFDIYDDVGRCTLDIICETLMGVTVNAQTTDSNYVKWSNKVMEILFTRVVGVLYQFDFIFKRTSMAKEYYTILKQRNDFIRAVVIEKRKAYQKDLKDNKEMSEILYEEEPRKRNTFLQQLVEVSEKGANFTDEEIRDEVDTFMTAGSETTASMESFTFIVLGMLPEIQEKVYEEVIDVIGPDRSVECQDLEKLQYLERVIKETMRIFPAGPVLCRTITGDVKLEKVTLPAGCSIGMVVMHLHRDPDVWPNPLKFDPDRFLPEEVAKRHPYSWLPFSAGPRNCIGTKYAMMAMKVVIATVVRKFRFSTDYKSIEDIELKSDIVLRPVDGFKVSLELRE